MTPTRAVIWWLLIGMVIGLLPIWYQFGNEALTDPGRVTAPVVLGSRDWAFALAAVVAGAFAQRLVAGGKIEGGDVLLFLLTLLELTFGIMIYAAFPPAGSTQDRITVYWEANTVLIAATIIIGGACTYRAASAAKQAVIAAKQS